ncbi:hypothetical protein Q604_UNBc4C00179G0001, partial [human gut metagenome]
KKWLIEYKTSNKFCKKMFKWQDDDKLFYS